MYFGGVNNIEKPLIFEIIDIRVLNHDTRSYACFGFFIDCLLHHLLKANGFLVLLFHFDLDKSFEAFSKITNHSRLIGGLNKCKLCQDGLKILQVRCSISHFFQLVLGISSKFIPNIVNKGLEISKGFSEEGLELKLYNRGGAFMAVFTLSSLDADGVTKE